MRPVPAIVAALRAEAARLACKPNDWKVEGRVFGGELPKDEINSGQPRRCIVVQQAGGGGSGPGVRGYLPWRTVRLHVRSYGATPDDADALDSQVYDYMVGLGREPLNDGLSKELQRDYKIILRDAVISGGPISQRDPDIHWPSVFSMYGLSVSPVC